MQKKKKSFCTLNMKANNKPCISPFTFKLEDCLACSSCISDFEPRKTFTYSDLYKEPLTILISPHSKISMFSHFKKGNMTFSDFECILISFIKVKFNINKIYDTSFIKGNLCESVYEESQLKNVIISDCPGTVAYIEKQAHHLLKYLSNTPTQQQAILDLVTGKSLSVVQCFDKMLETDSDVITTYDFYKILIEQGFLNYSTQKYILEDCEKCYIEYHYGYLEYILYKKYSSLNIPVLKSNESHYEDREIPININGKRRIKQNLDIKNKIYIKDLECTMRNGIYLFTYKTKKYIRILGLEPFLNFIRETKLHGMKYDVCEIYICDQGCINGPGQIYVKNIFFNENKEATKFIKNIKLKKRSFEKQSTRKVRFNVEW